MAAVCSKKYFCCPYFSFTFFMPHEIPFQLVFSFSRRSMHFSSTFRKQFLHVDSFFLQSRRVAFLVAMQCDWSAVASFWFHFKPQFTSLSFFLLSCYFTSTNSFTVCSNKQKPIKTPNVFFSISWIPYPVVIPSF